MYVGMNIHAYVYTLFFFSVSREGLGAVVMNFPSIQIFISKYHSTLGVTRAVLEHLVVAKSGEMFKE